MPTLNFDVHIGKPPYRPRHVTLLGDPSKRSERAGQVIELPGISLEVTRCSDPSLYWVHVAINADYAVQDARGKASSLARFDSALVKRADGSARDLPAPGDMTECSLLLLGDVGCVSETHPYSIAFPGGQVSLEASSSIGYQAVIEATGAVIGSRVVRNYGTPGAGVAPIESQTGIKRIELYATRLPN